MEDIKTLRDRFPREGRLEWIGIRPGRGEPMRVLEHIAADPEGGLEGERYKGKSRDRQVTLIQAEHLAAVASLLGREFGMEASRRNLVVSGINLRSLKHRRFRIGGEIEGVVLESTGDCPPCSYQEVAFGEGGYNAMRGHGGITARIVEGGTLAVGDAVAAVAETEPAG